MKTPTVYILASAPFGRLYIGVTSDLPAREWEHHTGATGGHSAKYNIKRLVWFEEYDTMQEAIQREKTMKQWYRKWKVELIEKTNPHWHRLHPETGEFIYDE